MGLSIFSSSVPDSALSVSGQLNGPPLYPYPHPANRWRSLGLAALLDESVVPFPTPNGPHLVPNDAVNWLALRDISPLRLANDFAMGNTSWEEACLGHARLSYGSPIIDVRNPIHEALNAGQPANTSADESESLVEKIVASHHRLTLHPTYDARALAITKQLSLQMTRAAFCGTDSHGNPWRPQWAAIRPQNWQLVTMPAPHQWLPTPYLGFDATTVAALRREISSSLNPCQTIKEGFCNALLEGLPLRAPKALVYVRAGSPNDLHSNFIDHWFESADDQCRIRLTLPKDSRIYVLPRGTDSDGQIPAGMIFGRGLARLPINDWVQADLQTRWTQRERICAGRHRLERLFKTWFDLQCLKVKESPDVMYVPAFLVSSLTYHHRPQTIAWDFGRCQCHYCPERHAFVFPPLRLLAWNKLRFSLPGGFDLDASMTRFRFDLLRHRQNRLLRPPLRQVHKLLRRAVKTSVGASVP